MSSLLILDGWNFSMANYGSVWSFLFQFGLLLIFLFIANILRNVIPFLRKSFIPSALLGGFLLLGFHYLLKLFGITLIDKSIMQVITYHGLGIGFVAMSLKILQPKSKKVNREFTIKTIDAGILTGGGYMIQAVFGLLITVLFWLGTQNSSNPIFYASGIILPLGFGQGPGNALTWDVNFSDAYADLFSGNGSFGLSIASIGFLVASVFGVLYINLMKKRGQIRSMNGEARKRVLSDLEGENEIPDSESVDKFTLQVGLVAIGYAMAFGFMVLLGKISNFTNSLAWGFNFLWGVFAANIIKLIYKFFRKHKIIQRNYINNYQMDRISGMAFDIMIVAGVAAIEINDIQRYIVPIIVLCAVGTLVTYVYVRVICKYAFKGYDNEMFLMNFGALTGTASNGLILLKEVDPNFETPTANLYVMAQVANMVTACPVLLLTAFCGKSLTNSVIALIIFTVLLIVYTIILLRRQIFRRHYKNIPENNLMEMKDTDEEPSSEAVPQKGE